MSELQPKIHIRDLCKAFGPKVILDGLDLDVMPGESVVIIGGSGTGKSVTLKSILGLIHPDSGVIEVDGQNAIGLTGRKREKINHQISMLFQGAALFDSLPVWENVSFGPLADKSVNRRQAKELAVEKLAQVGMPPEVANLFPSELSGGMQKRVGLARAIAGDPEIIFFDEPTTGLDPIMADVINDLIVKVNEEVGATALSITHDMASARKIADRIAMLYHGKIIWQGPADTIDDCDNPFVQQFINGSAEGPIEMAVRK